MCTTVNRNNFYENFRKEFGSLKQSQVDGFEAIFNEWELRKHSDLRWLAYILATVWHETAKTIQPIEEIGKGKNYRYGRKEKRNRQTYVLPNKIYFGRGHVQLTWYENYELLGRLLGIDLLNKPELMLVMDVSIKVLFEGMTKGASSFGDFTGKSLEDYFNVKTNDPLRARKIINGMDKAELIMSYHNKFLKCL